MLEFHPFDRFGEEDVKSLEELVIDAQVFDLIGNIVTANFNLIARMVKVGDANS